VEEVAGNCEEDSQDIVNGRIHALEYHNASLRVPGRKKIGRQEDSQVGQQTRVVGCERSEGLGLQSRLVNKS